VQDIEDDEIAGIRSSARFFGRRMRGAIGLCYGASVGFIALATILAGAGLVGLLGVTLFAAHLGRQVLRLDTRDGRGALTLFRSNREAGLILFLGFAADAAVTHLL
jgi:4-hydroxybenzoate polyprenyltransferase